MFQPTFEKHVIKRRALLCLFLSNASRYADGLVATCQSHLGMAIRDDYSMDDRNR